jgi:hypothetical protein
MLLKSVLQQNYFSFQNDTYQPEKGVSMGSPISNTDSSVNKTKKWATFTYHSHKIRKITNRFKQTDIKIAFRSTFVFCDVTPKF